MTKHEFVIQLLNAGCPGELAVWLAYSLTDIGIALLCGKRDFATWQIVEPAAPGRDAVMRPESVDETARRLIAWASSRAAIVAEAEAKRDGTPTPPPFPRPTP